LTRSDHLGAVTAPKRSNIFKCYAKRNVSFSYALPDFIHARRLGLSCGKRAAAHVPLPSITISKSPVKPKNLFVSTASPVFRGAQRVGEGRVYMGGPVWCQTHSGKKFRFFSEGLWIDHQRFRKAYPDSPVLRGFHQHIAGRPVVST